MVSVIKGQWGMSRANLAEYLLHSYACGDNTFYDLMMQLREDDEQYNRQH